MQFREFRLIWLGQFTTAMGQWMDQVTRGWLLYDLTGSPIQLGLVGALRFFPLLLLSPIAGTLADRYGRKTQLIISQTVNALANAVLGILIVQGGVHPWHVYATGLVAAIVQVFQVPARQALVPESVDRRHLTNAISLNALAFNVSRSLGPAAAGVVIALAGPGASYLMQAAIYGLSTLWTAQLSLPNLPPSDGAERIVERESFGRSTVAGWTYVVSHPTIRTVLLVSAVVSLFGMSFSTMLPAFAKDVLDAGPTGQGLLLTGMGVGAVGSAFIVALIGDSLPKGAAMTAGVAAYGLGVVAFAVSGSLMVSVVLMVVIGICNIFATTVLQTVLQAESAPTLRGRVMGVYQQHQLLIVLGGLLVGGASTIWGPQPAVGALGAACFLGAVAVFVFVPHVRSIR